MNIDTQNQPNEIWEQIDYRCSSDGFNSYFEGMVSCHSEWTIMGNKFPSSNDDTVILSLVSRDINERTDNVMGKNNFVITCKSYKQ